MDSVILTDWKSRIISWEWVKSLYYETYKRRNKSLASGRVLLYYSQYHHFHLGLGFHPPIFFFITEKLSVTWNRTNLTAPRGRRAVMHNKIDSGKRWPRALYDQGEWTGEQQDCISGYKIIMLKAQILKLSCPHAVWKGQPSEEKKKSHREDGGNKYWNKYLEMKVKEH